MPPKSSWKHKPQYDLSERDKEKWNKMKADFILQARIVNTVFLSEPRFPTVIPPEITFAQIEESERDMHRFLGANSITPTKVDDYIHSLQVLMKRMNRSAPKPPGSPATRATRSK